MVDAWMALLKLLYTVFSQVTHILGMPTKNGLPVTQTMARHHCRLARRVTSRERSAAWVSKAEGAWATRHRWCGDGATTRGSTVSFPSGARHTPVA